jgi:hypothetical protein
MEQFSPNHKTLWKWTAMIMQPEPVTRDLARKAVEEAGKKKNLPALSQLRFKSLEEGQSAQILHVGPYNAEAPTIQRLHDFIRNSGHGLRGKHHEIYLSDPRRAAPEKMKTVIRQPIQPSA